MSLLRIGDAEANNLYVGASAVQRVYQGNNLVYEVTFALTPTLDGEVLLIANHSVEITIASPLQYAGVYTINTATLSTGPSNLVVPLIGDDGTPAAGETLTIIPGLWIYDSDNTELALPVYQWQVDIAGDGNFVDIAGATSSTYTLTNSEVGRSVRVSETLSDSSGSLTVSSSAVNVSAGAPAFVTYVGSVTSSTPAGDPTSLTLPIGEADDDRWVVFSVHAFLRGNAENKISSITLNGNPCSILTSSGGTGSVNPIVLIAITDTKITNGTTATLVIDWVDGFEPNNSVAVHSESYRVIATNAPLVAGSATTNNNSLSLSITMGDVLIAGFMSQNTSDPSAGWSGASHRNSVDLATDEWASIADDLSISNAETRQVNNTQDGRRAGIVLRRVG